VKTLLAFLFFTFLPYSLLAQGRVPEPTLPAFFTDQSAQFEFKTFEDDHGGFFIVWTDSVPVGAAKLMAQHIGEQGQSLWGSSGVVVTSRLSSLQDWDGLADGQGGLTLFWDEGDGLYAQRFASPNGLESPKPVRMSTTTAIHPDAIPDASGGTLVTWASALADQGRPVVLAQRFRDGKPLWGASVRVSRRPSMQTNPLLVYDNMSGAIVAWRDEINQASELRVQRLDGTGTRLWGEEGLKVYAPMGVSEKPMIAALGAGDAVIAWGEYVTGLKRIFLQRVGPQAQFQWGDGKPASVETRVSRWNPLLHSDGQGGTWVAWVDFRNQQVGQVFLNHLGLDGEPVWAKGEMAVAPALGDQGFVAMADDGKDGVWLAWVDNRGWGVSLYAQRIDASGQRLCDESGLKIASKLKSPSVPQIVTLGNGKAAVVWADRVSKKEWRLYWYNLTSNVP